MSIEIFKVTTVYGHPAYFTKREDAQAVISGIPLRDGPNFAEECAFESAEEYNNFANGSTRKQALAKLTPAERKALGVKE